MINNYYLIFSSILFIIFLLYIQEIESINCFECNSRTDRECEFLMANDTRAFQYIKCNQYTNNEEPPFCRKIVQYIKDYDIYRVIRKCGYVRHTKDCYTVRNSDHDETVCQCFEDGCNGASTTSISILTLSLVGLLYKFFI